MDGPLVNINGKPDLGPVLSTGKGPFINYVVSKSEISDPCNPPPPVIFFIK